MKIVILIIFILLSSPFAYAQTAETPPYPTIVTKDDARPLQVGTPGRVDQMIDGIRLRLNDGRIVQLSGIDVPEDAALAAKEFLDALFAKDSQRDVILYQTPAADKGRTTRMGHILGQLVRKDGTVWIQGAMIEAGIARAWPTPTNPELADQMFALEQKAITGEKGLWAKDSPHRLMIAADDLDTAGRMAVVEGTITKVAMINNVTYLNFGDDWRRDFTVALPAALRQTMTRKGQDPFRLQGQKMRIRGWLRAYNGPFIELEHPVLLQQDMKTDETNRP